MKIPENNFNIDNFNYSQFENSNENVSKLKSDIDLDFLQKHGFVLSSKIKKQKKNFGRLNALDNEYFDDMEVTVAKDNQDKNIFFVPNEYDKIKSQIGTTFKSVVENVPVINSIFLKTKAEKLKKAISGLNEITKNVSDIMSSNVPYGEENQKYDDITKHLAHASDILGQVKKEI